MASKHVINDFQAWSEGRINKKQRPVIEQHLKECTDCRAYFEKMSMLLDRMGPASLPRLDPDPYLPTRIRAMSEGKKASVGGGERIPNRTPRPRLFGRAGIAAMGLMIIAAAWVGAYFGGRLSTLSLAASQSETENLVGSFYDEFSRSGFTGDWETILETQEEESNET